MPRGNRHDCPKCGGLRTVTHSDEAFYCHKCQWKGNTVSLAKELGLYQRLSTAECREVHQRRERASRAARELYEGVKARRFELLDDLHSLNRLELQAHQAGVDDPATWGALALVYAERPGILAGLAFLENSPADKLLQFLSATPEQGQAVGEAILLQGGMSDYAGKFVEVCPWT